LSGTDLGNAATVDSEISGDVVLPISAREHPFNDRYLSIVQSHLDLSVLSRIGEH
jgi:hypothetical protein